MSTRLLSRAGVRLVAGSGARSAAAVGRWEHAAAVAAALQSPGAPAGQPAAPAGGTAAADPADGTATTDPADGTATADPADGTATGGPGGTRSAPDDHPAPHPEPSRVLPMSTTNGGNQL